MSLPPRLSTNLAAGFAIRVAAMPVNSPGRQAQRAAGAAAAAAALAAVGCPHPPLGTYAPDGCPLWPDPFAGSIAHTADLAVAAAAARSAHIAALGIDVEVNASLPASEATWVLDDPQRRAVAAHPKPDVLATLLWSAKEAAFKAWSAATGGLGDVDPCDIATHLPEPCATSGSLRLVAQGSLRSAVAPFGAAEGAYVVADDYVFTLVRVAAPSTPQASPG